MREPPTAAGGHYYPAVLIECVEFLERSATPAILIPYGSGCMSSIGLMNFDGDTDFFGFEELEHAISLPLLQRGSDLPHRGCDERHGDGRGDHQGGRPKCLALRSLRLFFGVVAGCRSWFGFGDVLQSLLSRTYAKRGILPSIPSKEDSPL